MEAIRIEPFDSETVAETAGMLARAFSTNPINMAALGEGRLAKNEALFIRGLPEMKGSRFVALKGTQIVGFVRWVDSSSCQITGLDRILLVPSMTGVFGLPSALRIAVWYAAWSRHDPDEPHVHLGPIGVEPEMQGSGIGGRLMERYCRELDREGKAGYLETDRPENVAFYQRFGFETIAEAPVLGVANYFMWRKGRSSHQSARTTQSS